MSMRVPLHGRLAGGLFATVDDEDFDLVSAMRWWPDFNKATIYAVRQLRHGEPSMMHQIVFGPVTPPCIGIDHIDGNGLNNTRSNLRPVNPQQNSANRRKRPGKTSSVYKGVSRRRGRIARPWEAYVGVNNRMIRLGNFVAEEDAARAYDAAALVHFGEYACLNFPTEVSK